MLQEGGPVTGSAALSVTPSSSGGKGGGEGARTARKTTSRTNPTGQTSSGAVVKSSGVGGDGVKSMLSPLAIVASSGQL